MMNGKKLKKFIAVTAFAVAAALAGTGSYTVYATESASPETEGRTEGFFWSDVVPVPSYATPNEDGTPGKMGVVVDGKRIEEELPSYEEAIANRVLVLVNGKYLHTYSGTGGEPFIEEGRTMVPLRAVADAFGFKVEWEQIEQKITLTKDETDDEDDKIIILHIGRPEILINDETVYFEDAVPMIKNGRTFLPVRKFAEILEIKVEWDNDTRTATFGE